MTDLSITDFITARLDDGEAEARSLLRWAQDAKLALEEPRLLGTTQVGWHTWADVERLAKAVLADIAAKRQIVEGFAELTANRGRLTDPALHLQWNVMRRVVFILASPYADHPDFNPNWSAIARANRGDA